MELLGQPTAVNRREMRWSATYDLVLTVCGGKQGLWYDFNSGVGGDMLELARHSLGVSIAEAITWMREKLAAPAASPTPWLKGDANGRTLAERIEAARMAYARGKAARGTLAERYFVRRGLDVPEVLWRQLRFDPACRMQEGIFPAVLMPLRDCLSFEIVGVHKIALEPDAANARRADGRKLKKSAGRVKGAAMMLGRPGENLAVCEGLETALGMRMSGLCQGWPIWALTGASFLAELQPVPGVERFLIGADNDPSGVGLKAARAAAMRWRDAGVPVEIGWPTTSGKDFADVYRHSEDG
ncbi:DUF7146 domain-containing protein [Mesorhizobium tamadayense]|uniref:DUF7146 domain-containing protein n=1 Tax=Mesorhizobium tamadayense TaxID=425306 RepID=UPI00142D2D21|nr:toprim domain-containing protein [Mesorhizobium tamadayense]